MLHGIVIALIVAVVAAGRVFFHRRSANALEVLALRQQLAVLKRKRPQPALGAWEKYSGPAYVAVAALVGDAGNRPTGYSSGLASRGLPPLLALAIAAARWADRASILKCGR